VQVRGDARSDGGIHSVHHRVNPGHARDPVDLRELAVSKGR
jgi:hypothetical protein